MKKELYLVRHIESEDNRFATENGRPICFDSLEKASEYLLNRATAEDAFFSNTKYKILNIEKSKYVGYYVNICPINEEDNVDTYVIVPFTIRNNTNYVKAEGWF